MERVPFREWDSFFRSCFKFIPRQGLNMAGTYLLAMIILFLNKFKTASNISRRYHLYGEAQNHDSFEVLHRLS